MARPGSGVAFVSMLVAPGGTAFRRHTRTVFLDVSVIQQHAAMRRRLSKTHFPPYSVTRAWVGMRTPSWLSHTACVLNPHLFSRHIFKESVQTMSTALVFLHFVSHSSYRRMFFFFFFSCCLLWADKTQLFMFNDPGSIRQLLSCRVTLLLCQRLIFPPPSSCLCLVAAAASLPCSLQPGLLTPVSHSW